MLDPQRLIPVQWDLLATLRRGNGVTYQLQHKERMAEVSTFDDNPGHVEVAIKTIYGDVIGLLSLSSDVRHVETVVYNLLS